jgi:flagellar basal body L-ring protein FlgH
VKTSPDLSDDVTVAIYKGLDNGPLTVSEDTSLEVEGEERLLI